jgi:hypothetical protein
MEEEADKWIWWWLYRKFQDQFDCPPVCEGCKTDADYFIKKMRKNENS